MPRSPTVRAVIGGRGQSETCRRVVTYRGDLPHRLQGSISERLTHAVHISTDDTCRRVAADHEPTEATSGRPHVSLRCLDHRRASDLIVVVMRGSGFTALEKTIMSSGGPDRVVAMRHDFQNMMTKRLTETRAAGSRPVTNNPTYPAAAARSATPTRPMTIPRPC
jgi:hypothetical protein